MKIQIKGARILNPAAKIDKLSDCYFSDGQLLGYNEPDAFSPDRVIEAEGLWLLPGLIDTTAQVSEQMGLERQAALSSGITHLICPPTLRSCFDDARTVQQITNTNSPGARVLPLGGLTKGLQGAQLSDLYALKLAGAPAVTNANIPIQSTLVTLQCYQYAANSDILVVIRPQDPDLYANTVAHEGQISTRLGLPSSPACAESIAVMKHLELIAHTGVRAHFTALSAARSVELIAEAKAKGLYVTASVAAHHLHLSEIDLCDLNPNAHLMPPLRTERDKNALLQGVLDGTIDCICSDHQPCQKTDKLAPFGDTLPGSSGINTLLSLVLHHVTQKKMPLDRAIDALTTAPARIFGINHNDGNNFCLVDPTAHWTVNSQTLQSTGKNSVVTGWSLPGVVRAVFLNGQLVHDTF